MKDSLCNKRKSLLVCVETTTFPSISLLNLAQGPRDVPEYYMIKENGARSEGKGGKMRILSVQVVRFFYILTHYLAGALPVGLCVGPLSDWWHVTDVDGPVDVYWGEANIQTVIHIDRKTERLTRARLLCLYRPTLHDWLALCIQIKIINDKIHNDNILVFQCCKLHYQKLIYPTTKQSSYGLEDTFE